MKSLKPVYVIAGKRTPFAKSGTVYAKTKINDLMGHSLNALVESQGLKGKTVGDVAFGAVMNSSLNWPMPREVVLGSGLHPYTPAYYIQRACGTGLEATWNLALKIGAGQIPDAIAGGVDTNSDVPIEVNQGYRDWLLKLNAARTMGERLGLLAQVRPSFLAPKFPQVAEARTGMSMGEHCELMVKEWKISREAQDELAYRSHKNGAKAYDEGFFKDMVVPFGKVDRDATLRGDTTLEKLAKLKPAFDKSPAGTLTAGNSSPMTDGSSCVLIAGEESMKQNHWMPMARLVDFESAAVDFVHGDGLLMAPTVAVSRLLDRNNLKLQDFDYYEIHEAFAGQVLCTLKAWESAEYCKKYMGKAMPLGSIDITKMNVVGSSVAVGHPFSATGARLVMTLAKLLTKKKGRGLISICTAGGMGVAAILESV
ncbi:MAG: acetyl-CoA C-acetyltransferase [Bdellovibrionaceae bacterium]|nr:acetyl-CoA C-acetyltransferase [Pseudobdellovibrionaceae bacterium]